MPDNEQSQRYPDGSEYGMPSQFQTEQSGFDLDTEAQVPSENSAELVGQEQTEKVGDHVLDIAGVDEPAINGEPQGNIGQNKVNSEGYTDGRSAPDDARYEELLTRVKLSSGGDFSGRLKELLAFGVGVDAVVQELHANDISRGLSVLLESGANVKQIVDKMGPDEVADNLVRLQQAGAQIDMKQLVTEISRHNLPHDLDQLLTGGADVRQIVDRMLPPEIAYNIDKLQQAGAQIDVDELVKQLDASSIMSSLDKLLVVGAHIDTNRLMEELPPHRILDGIELLLKAGADVDRLADSLTSGGQAANLDRLLAAGAHINIDELVRRLSVWDLAKNIDQLQRAGANIDIMQVIEQIDSPYIRYVDQFLAAGASPDQLVRKMDKKDLDFHILKLLNAGASANLILERCLSRSVGQHFDEFLQAGASPDLLVETAPPFTVLSNAEKLVAAGAEPDRLIEKIPPGEITYNISKLLEIGVSVDRLVELMSPDSIRHRIIDQLLLAGADVRMLMLRMNKEYIFDSLEKLAAAKDRSS